MNESMDKLLFIIAIFVVVVVVVEALRPSHVGTEPPLKSWCVLLKDTTRWFQWDGTQEL